MEKIDSDMILEEDLIKKITAQKLVAINADVSKIDKIIEYSTLEELLKFAKANGENCIHYNYFFDDAEEYEIDEDFILEVVKEKHHKEIKKEIKEQQDIIKKHDFDSPSVMSVACLTNGFCHEYFVVNQELEDMGILNTNEYLEYLGEELEDAFNEEFKDFMKQMKESKE